jgi:hypothetical protein
MKNKFTYVCALVFVLMGFTPFNQAKATPLSASITSYNNVYCFGGNSGSATVTAGGGTSPYTYSWSDGSSQTTLTATGLTAGSYTVTVTDAASNTATASVYISEPCQLTANVSSVTYPACSGEIGSATCVANCGNAPYTYEWVPLGGNTATGTGFSEGTYTLIVTDNNACQATASVTITQPPPLGSNPTFTAASCNLDNGSATANVTGGTSPYTYNWNPTGYTTATITGISAGYYWADITDANGCTATANVTVTQPIVVTISAEALTYPQCNGGDGGSAIASASGGLTPYTYVWNPTGEVGTTATGLAAGCYTITVADANGCEATTSICITQPSQLNPTTSFTAASCGLSNGTATVSVTGGTLPYTYTWLTAPVQTGVTAIGLTAGCYTVLVTDNNSCTATAVVCVTQPSAVIALIGAITNVRCNGSNDGTIQGNVSGGTTPYAYVWEPSGEYTPTMIGATAGCYTLAVTDANGCIATASACITQPSLVTPAIFSTTANTSCTNPNGDATVTTFGGTGAYTYLWSPTDQTTATAIGLAAYTYTCTVTDNNGCTANTTATVGGTTAPILTLTSTSDTGTCSGTATVTVVGVGAPYTYSWNSGQTTSSINNLCAGYEYCCTVTDNGGCSNTSCVTIVSCTNAYVQPICIITLDTATNKCELIWGRTSSPPAGSTGQYNVYKDTTSGYVLIHSQPLDSLSEYIDPTSNPSLAPQSYEISTVDSCGESALSPPHTSIYLTTTAGVNVYILSWTAYVGFTPSEYIIFRGPSLSTLVPIDTVANTVLTFHDTLPPINSYYVLEAVSPSGPCVATHGMHNTSISLLSGSFSNGFNTATLGINNLGNEVTNVKMYPNPSNGMFTLSYSVTENDNLRISIINELGQEVYAEQKHISVGTNTELLNLETLASGIYSLRIQTNNGIVVRKLVIMQGR